MENYTYELIKIYNGKNYLASVIQYSPNNEVWFVSEDYTVSSYTPTYEIELRNNELIEFKTIRCKEYYISERVEAVFKRWAEMEVKKNKIDLMKSSEDKVIEMNESIDNSLKLYSNILKSTLNINDEVDWNTLKDKRKYSIPVPKEIDYEASFPIPQHPVKREYKKYGIEPWEGAYHYKPKFTFWDKLSSSKKQNKINHYQKLYENDLTAWKNNCIEVDRYNQQCDELYEIEVSEHNKKIEEIQKLREASARKYQIELIEWENKKKNFYEDQEIFNLSIDARKQAYNNCDVEAVISYNQIVLERSSYPDIIDKTFHIEYNPDEHLLLIDYLLPHYEKIPAVKEYKYIKSRDDITEKKRSEAEMNMIYESICYQLALRTLHEVFEADSIDAVRITVFNGFAKELDVSKGVYTERCILSVKANKDEFFQINIENVDPKSCFKEALKGKSMAKLNKFTEVVPEVESTRIWQFEREKKESLIDMESATKLDNTIVDIVDSVKQNKSAFKINFAVKGLNYRSVDEQLSASKLNIGDALILEKEPDNKFDEYAIKALTNNKIHIGYVERDYSKEVSNNLPKLEKCVVSKIDSSRNINCPFIYAEAYFRE